MAIDRTGITSLQSGAGEITYSGNQGPKSPDQQLMAQADPMFIEMYEQYVFEMEEQGLQPMPFRDFMQQIIAESKMAKGGRAGYQGGQLVKPPGITDEEWYRIMYGSKGPRPLSSQSPYLSVHADGGRANFLYGGGADRMPPEPRPMGNPPVMEKIEDMREFRIANPDSEDIADYKGYYERLKKLEQLRRLMQGVRPEPMAYGGMANPTYTQKRKQSLAYGGIAGVDGRKRYGIGSFFQDVKDKFVDDIIPNEIKENPLMSSVAAGALLNQFGIPFTGTPGDRMGQNWFSDLISGAQDTAIKDSLKMDIVPAGAEEIIKANTPLESKGPMGDEMWNLTGGGINPSYTDAILRGVTGAATPPAPEEGGLWNALKRGASNLFETATSPSEIDGREVQWKIPLGIGMSMGALQAAMPKDTMPQDTSGIDIANIRSRALTGSDPNLKFLPPASATTAYANGGRIGYDSGGYVPLPLGRWNDIGDAFEKYQEDNKDTIGPLMGFKEFFNNYIQNMADGGRIGYDNGGDVGLFNINDYYKDEYNKYIKDIELGLNEFADTPMSFSSFVKMLREDRAQGGRIGYDSGGSASDRYEAKIKELMDKGLSRELAEVLVISELSPDAYKIIPEDKAQGGRIGAQEGGLMDLGGMEKDYRNEGGFVPIGGQERADDVPARLSKNEFVFTADAVRSAGGGDIDKGAEVMENVMEHLEQGGQISEDSQGLEGARNMFATAQRLEGVM